MVLFVHTVEKVDLSDSGCHSDASTVVETASFTVPKETIAVVGLFDSYSSTVDRHGGLT